MALNLTLDPAVRLIVEPGYDQNFSALEVAQGGMPAGEYSAQNLWHDPAYGVVMIKPRQLQPGFLTSIDQITTGAIQRLSLQLHANPIDISTQTVYTSNIGSINNPWIAHAPVALVLPFPGISPIGIVPYYSLGDIYNTSEGSFLLVPLVDSQQRYAANRGFFFRWYVPRADLVKFPTVYALALGQYFFILKDTQVEVYVDLSPHGDRSKWQHSGTFRLFGPASTQDNPTQNDWSWGQLAAPPSPDREHSLLILPYARSKILLMSQNQGYAVVNVRNQPHLLPDKSDWDILRSDSALVWATSAAPGRFQLQEVVYGSSPATLDLQPFLTEYTPVGPPLGTPPAVKTNSDAAHGASIVTTLEVPPLYVIPGKPWDNDCPMPTTAGTAQFRTYGCSLELNADPSQRYTPQFYSLDFHVEPVFMDNPASPTIVLDGQASPGNVRPVVMSAEVSMGTRPGDGRLNAVVMDFPPNLALKSYYDRTEMPVALQTGGIAAFLGYTNRLTHRPLRQTETNAPVELNFTADDRWLLLETSYLRDQRDYTDVGHITAVNAIVRQCGIDTGYAFDTAPTGSPVAEYPTGWNGVHANQYNTPLFSTQDLISADNLTDLALSGWKPQPYDTGAMFLKRVVDYFSGWLMGFRLDGTFYYLPYYYFTSPSVSFFMAGHGGVQSGLTLNQGASVGLALMIDAGAGIVGSQSVNFPGGFTGAPVTDNAVSYVWLNNAGEVHTAPVATPTPFGVLLLGTVTAAGGAIASVNMTGGSGRHTSGSPVYRNPVEFRAIEPTANVVQASSTYLQDNTYNRSGLFVDWASVKNPAADNYLGRYKWLVEEVNGAFNCAIINSLAWIVWQRSRFKRKRVVFEGDFVPSLKIGQVFFLEGYGNFRLLEVSARLLKSNWQVATYTGEVLFTDAAEGLDYAARASTGGEITKELADAIRHSARNVSIEEFGRRAVRAPGPGRIPLLNSPYAGNSKFATQNFFTTGYDTVSGKTVSPFTVDRSRVGGSDTVTM